MIDEALLPELQRALGEARVDGWLLFDFHGTNEIASSLLGLQGMVTRRVFAWIPAKGTPVAITHAIEQGPWVRWPAAWDRRIYSSWRTLEAQLAELVKGKRAAMEYSPGDAVPYVDRIPAGVLEMVRAAGATVVPSADLVSRFYARWTPAQAASHDRAAAAVAAIAREALTVAGTRARDGRPQAEHEVASWIREAFERAGLETDHGPIVAIGPNAANPHYAPSSSRPVPIVAGSMLLIDLWAREPNGGLFADQTWMASLGPPNAKSASVWEAVRDARDAAIALGTKRLAAGDAPTGGALDDAARAVITARGYGEYFIHRTGHSIDAQSLHGAGPHLDNLETREERTLIDGVGFSIEPGVYLPGVLGVRSEVNARVDGRKLVVTPADYQRELMIV